MKNDLWVEKYRPSTLDGYVFQNEAQRKQITKWIIEKNIPHLLFSGGPGTGKTTVSKILINALEIHPYDLLEINASRDNSVDSVRDRITNFVSTMSFGGLRVVFLDECLDKDTLVTCLRDGAEQLVKISELDDKHDLVKSYNTETQRVEWQPFTWYDKGVQDTLEIEFENGEVVICTPDHKWYVQDPVDHVCVVKASELLKYNHILVAQDGLHKLGIVSIKPGSQRHVYDLSVLVNHNFFITEKQILTHNCDYLSPNAQGALRNVMETFADNARFIMTCNYPHRVIPAIRGRCQGFHITTLDQVEFTSRVAEILLSEQVDFDLDLLDTYVRSTYPDLRKCINVCQQNTIDQKLILDQTTNSTSDYLINAVELFKTGRIREARQLICSQVRAEELDELISWTYKNLDLWGSTPEEQDAAILIIRKAAVNASMVADQEINIAALFVELANINK